MSNDTNSNVLHNYECGNFIFSSKFDSGNLGKVEEDNLNVFGEIAHTTFNVWTTPDCFGTPNESPNRTWFFFSIKGGYPHHTVQINVKNLNRQAKLFSHGMAPVMRIGTNGKWHRIKDKPTYHNEDDNFEISFLHHVNNIPDLEVYYAFTYPFTYTECQNMLSKFDEQYEKSYEEINSIINRLSTQKDESIANLQLEKNKKNGKYSSTNIEETINPETSHERFNKKKLIDEIYYHRELLVNSIENRRVDLLTISSFKGIQHEREEKLSNIFPDKTSLRCHSFQDKKIIFLSSRVHPGETPASFVMNGFLNLLLDRKSVIASNLRRIFVFKIVPILNPDGVYNGYYRTDTLGQNLNRMYLNPTLTLHPSIYAVKKLIRLYHYKVDDYESDSSANESFVLSYSLTGSTKDKNKNNSSFSADLHELSPSQNFCTSQLSRKYISEEDNKPESSEINNYYETKSNIHEELNPCIELKLMKKLKNHKDTKRYDISSKTSFVSQKYNNINKCSSNNVDTENQCDLFLYLDMHGHASKKGVFMYGNHFSNTQNAVECMLLPKLMSINCPHFHFDACNFSEKNMYRREKRDGLSKEGSGRVTVYKMTGLIRSYTLECNYNSGKYVNSLPSKTRSIFKKIANFHPPKYTPTIFEEVGRSLGTAILDMTNTNNLSRLQNSDFHSLQGLRIALKNEIDRSSKPSRLYPSITSSNKAMNSTHQMIKSIKGKLLETNDQFLPITNEKTKENKETNVTWNSEHSSLPITASKLKKKDINCYRKTAFKTRPLNVYGKKDSPNQKKLSNISIVSTSQNQKQIKKKFKEKNPTSPYITTSKKSEKLLSSSMEKHGVLSFFKYKKPLLINLNNNNNNNNNNSDDNSSKSAEDLSGRKAYHELIKTSSDTTIYSDLNTISSAPDFLQPYMDSDSSVANQLLALSLPSTSDSTLFYNSSSVSVFEKKNTTETAAIGEKKLLLKKYETKYSNDALHCTVKMGNITKQNVIRNDFGDSETSIETKKKRILRNESIMKRKKRKNKNSTF